MMGGLATLLPAAPLVAAVAGVRQLMGEMDDLADTALRLNESTETLQRVEYASTLIAGVDLEGVTSSFLRLEKSIGDVENAASNKALEHYGITAESLTRLPLDEKIVVLAEAFQKARDEGTGYNDIVALLGKSAGDLIPLLEQSGDTLRQTFAEAPVVVDGAVQKMAALNDQVDAFLAKQKQGITEFIGIAMMVVDDIFDPNKKLGDNMKEATAAAAATLDQQQARRDKAADSLKKQQEAANAATRAKEVAQQALEVERLRERIGERQFANLMRNLTPLLQIEALEKRITQEKKIQRFAAESGSEAEQLEATDRLLKLQQELASAKRSQQQEAEKAAEKEKAAAEDAKRKAEEAARLQQNALDLQKEMEALRAEAAGDNQKAEELRREMGIEQEKRRIMQETGMAEAEALKLAKERQNLNERLANAGKEDAPKINARISGGVAEARERAAARVTAARARSDNAVTDAFGTFEGEQARLKDSFAAAFGPASQTAAGAPQNPAQVQAAQNSQARTPVPEGSTDQIKIELMRQLLDALKG